VIDNCSAKTAGGGISAEGNLTLNSVKINNCTAAFNGGGLYDPASSGNVEIIGTTISGCTASAYGGGIYKSNGGDTSTIKITDSSVESCSAGNNGGGFYVTNNSATVSGSVRITGNTGLNEKTDNCFLPNSNQLNLGDGLTEDAEIGVGVQNPASTNNPATDLYVTANESETSSNNYVNALPRFFSDDPDYVITKCNSLRLLMIGYAIEYDLDGGLYDSGSNPASYNCYDEFTLTNPTKTGYEFLGWTGSNGAEPQKSVQVNRLTHGKLSYKANWKINQYTVKFESNGGTAVANQTVNYNEKVVKPADPTKSGYVFKGWFKDSDLTEEYDFNTPVTGDLTLYAKWGEPEPTTPSTPTPITVNDPPVRKTISGDTPTTDETFTFSLSAQPEMSTLPSGMTSMPMPGGVSEQTVTTTIVGSGSSEFGTFTFTAPGTYVYKITEVDTGAANYEYDSSEYLVTYVVTESGGNLYSTRTITKDGVVVTEAEYSFVNTYTTPESPDEPDEPDEPDNPMKPDKPTASDTTTHPDGGSSAGGTGVNAGGGVRTGDPTDLGLWLVILLAASGTAVILVRRHRADRR
jgi:pilin isopeptide linkage protein/uncharacterized repeat protein (TIGR02543 family)